MLICKYLVEKADLEATYQHVHHARALEFLERARLELLERINQPSAALISADLYPVVYKLEVVYMREVLGGEISVSCEQGRIEGKSFFVTQRLLNSKGKVCLLADVECKLMQGSSKRAVIPPADFERSFMGFFRSSGKLDS